jgi:phage minor structural protein
MIIYFADRKMNILGLASTNLKKGLMITDDLKVEDVETGVASFECKISCNSASRLKLEEAAMVGNYILRKQGSDNEFYTIIESEFDTKSQELHLYAEDAGLDLLNEVVGAYEADKAYPIRYYIQKFSFDSGFVIGINEIPNLTRKLSWDGECTATERLASVATQFDNCEISYSFTIKGMDITGKYINIHKKRGHDIGCQLRLNKEIDSIVTKKTIANLATALEVTGGTPEPAEGHEEEEQHPITLSGYSYDDGDFYVSGTKLLSRKALEKWSRYLYPKEPNKEKDVGHIVKAFSYDTLSQSELCNRAVSELKEICDLEVNYEVDITRFPDNIRIGDRIDVIDDEGGLYLSTRILQFETSITNKEQKATLGEHIIKEGGISQKVQELAEEFSKHTVSVQNAMNSANVAKGKADSAVKQAEAALQQSEDAKTAADSAKQSADTAFQSATEAQKKADEAETSVGKVVESVTSLETTVKKAQEAADNAYLAADTAEKKAEGAVATSGEAKALSEAASATAQAAKADAVQAQKEIDSLGDSLDTLSQTMEADYARKTDLTETEAHLQTQISQNAAGLSSTASKVQKIDETVNNAADLAAQAQQTAADAQKKADAASQDAVASQAAADAAKQAAASAQSEADKAKEAATTAQSVADKAEADLQAAKEDLASVQGRVDATEEDILAAQQAVDEAAKAAEKAKTDAANATAKADSAQTAADKAVTDAGAAQQTANDAADKALLAQKVAEEAKGNATTAQQTADAAAQAAAKAQSTADQAVSNAVTAQATAQEAAQKALAAQNASDEAAKKAEAAQTDLDAAKQNLADVTSKVDATAEEVEAAQAAVTKTQEAAHKANAEAAAAQATADKAKTDAATAQSAADKATAAADEAQKQAEAAKAAADKAQADANALAVRVTEAETDIRQNAEEIKLRATKKEVTQTLGGYYTKKETDAAIKVQSDSITQSVKQQIDSIEVGGRNLLIGTKNGVSKTGTGVANEATKEYKYSDYGKEILHNGTQKEITISFDWKTSDAITGTIEVQSCFSNWNSFGITELSEIKQSGHVVTTVKIPEDWNGSENTGMRFRLNSVTGTVDFSNLKLEIGNKATDWSPSPEDMATSEDAQNAQYAADEAKERAKDASDLAKKNENRLTISESTIKQLSDSICTMVKDKNGSTVLTQNSSGWQFDLSAVEKNLNNTANEMNKIAGTVTEVDSAIKNLNQTVQDLGKKTAYIVMTTDENGAPCIELGKEDNPFKVRITNTSVDFLEGSSRIAYVNNKALYIEKAIIKNELQIGEGKGFVWQIRANGNMGLRKIG